MVSVTVYSTGPGCMQCRLTSRCLDDAGIAHTTIDLSDPDNAAAREYVTDELGYCQAPVVVVDDEPQHHWSGFQPDRITRLAARAGSDHTLVAAPRRTLALYPTHPMPHPAAPIERTLP